MFLQILTIPLQRGDWFNLKELESAITVITKFSNSESSTKRSTIVSIIIFCDIFCFSIIQTCWNWACFQSIFYAMLNTIVGATYLFKTHPFLALFKCWKVCWLQSNTQKDQIWCKCHNAKNHNSLNSSISLVMVFTPTILQNTKAIRVLKRWKTGKIL